ncbi:MotA/TolQ/ExbB proton channel family protein [Cerasibacillus sp. JNUCC 74]
MVESILKLFTTEQKAEAILANPIVELIFIILFSAFVLALIVHLTIFRKLKHIRNYLKNTGRMDIEPVLSFKEQYEIQQQQETVKVETFVQEKFASFRMFHIPIISLIKMIQMTVSVFILLGVLGTFIGLTSSLGSINLEGNEIVEGVANVLTGIDVAFYTSIAGMGFSLIMTILMKVLNTEFMLTDIMLMTETKLEGTQENGLNRLITVSETIHESILHLTETSEQSFQTIVFAFKGFQDYTTGLQQSAKDLASFNDGLATNLKDFQQLFHNMKSVTEDIATGTNRLNDNFATLFTYFKRMDKRNERMMQALENTFEKAKEQAGTQLDILRQFESSVDEIKQFTTSLLNEQAALKAVFTNIQAQSKDLVKQIEKQNREFKTVFGTGISTKLTGIISQLHELSGVFDHMGNSLIKLPEALDVINQTQAEYKHLLTDRFQDLKEFNRTFHHHLKSHATNMLSFEKQMKDATGTYEQMAMKNSQFIQEINTTMTEMNQIFKQQDTHLENQLHVLKDALTNYVNNLEGSLGQKLEHVAQSIQSYLREINDGLRTEFYQLRRNAENSQQSQERFIQQILQELGREIQILNQHLAALSQRTYTQNNQIRLNQNEF